MFYNRIQQIRSCASAILFKLPLMSFKADRVSRWNSSSLDGELLPLKLDFGFCTNFLFFYFPLLLFFFIWYKGGGDRHTLVEPGPSDSGSGFGTVDGISTGDWVVMVASVDKLTTLDGPALFDILATVDGLGSTVCVS